MSKSFLLDSISNNPPICLTPDRLASVHRINYESIKYDQMCSQTSLLREQEFLMQIEDLTQKIKEKDLKFYKETEKLCQSILLLQLEIQRLRTILCEIDAEGRRMKDEVGNIQNTYRLRLEQVKKILGLQFEEEFNQLKNDNLMDLESIKAMYVTKISGMQAQFKWAEEEMIRKSNEIQNKQTFLTISSMKIEQLSKKIEMKSSALKELEKQKDKESESYFKEKQLLERDQMVLRNELATTKEQNDLLNKENQEIKEKIYSFKVHLQQMYEANKILQVRQKQLEDSLECSQFKYQILQKELKQFQKRKTQNRYSLNKEESLSNYMESSKKHIKNGESKDSKERLFEVKTEEILNEQINGLTYALREKDEERQAKEQIFDQQIQELRSQLEKRETKQKELEKRIGQKGLLISELEQKMDKKELKIRQLKDEILSVHKKCQERIGYLQRHLEGLSNEWELKEKEMSSLFRLIENRYIKQISEQEKKLKENEDCIKGMMDAISEKAKEVEELRKKKK